MNPMTEKQLEKMLRQTPSGARPRPCRPGPARPRRARRPDRRRLRDGRLAVRRAARRPHRPGRRQAGAAHPSRQPALPRRGARGAGDASSRRECSSRPKRLDEERRELEDYFEGRRQEFDVPVDWSLTSPGFRSRALHAVARIPYGKTRTYAEIAKSAGNPRAFRAAGTACGSNPIPLIVPCHRVVQSGGGIGNYGGGPEMKRELLGLEGAL